jgi:electron transfer flavoprotein alpha subunit
MCSTRDLWVFAEQREGEIAEVSLEVLTLGRGLADERKEAVIAVTFGANDENTVGILASYGADKVYLITAPLVLEGCIEPYEESLSQLIKEKTPKTVLFGATLMGNDLASRVASRVKTGLVSDCIHLSLNDSGLLMQTKLTHGGKIASTMICPRSRPEMVTVRPGLLEKRKLAPDRTAEVISINPKVPERQARLIIEGVVKADPEKIGLDEAEIIVAGGRGMGNADGFELLRGLAQSLGGIVGASLGAIDEELMPRKSLVGQTGTTVTPKLYIACGISGSIYHILGMKDSEMVVAINKDRSAPIFRYSDMGLLGDAKEIIPAIINRIIEMRNDAARNKRGDVHVRAV